MKRYLSILLSCFTATIYANEQQNNSHVTVEATPAICYGRVHTDPDTMGYESMGVGFGLKIGGSYEHYFTENVALSIGAAFSNKSIGVENKKKTFGESHAIQHIQIPFLLRLFTSEIELDLRMYAELGLAPAITFNSYIKELKEGTEPLTKKMRIGELSALLGIGCDYRITLLTTIFGGIIYQAGLTSVFPQEPNSTPIMGYSDMIGLTLGARF